ncbi:hypothetical protein JCM10213_007416 [Rhodosporidiobolus nylandii]
MSLADKTEFERERDRLIGEVADSLGKALNALNTLNRNIESTANVGEGFRSVHGLWSQFADVMQSGSYTDAEEQPTPILPRNDETIRLPAGLAPGGGDDAALDLAASHGASDRSS